MLVPVKESNQQNIGFGFSRCVAPVPQEGVDLEFLVGLYEALIQVLDPSVVEMWYEFLQCAIVVSNGATTEGRHGRGLDGLNELSSQMQFLPVFKTLGKEFFLDGHFLIFQVHVERWFGRDFESPDAVFGVPLVLRVVTRGNHVPLAAGHFFLFQAEKRHDGVDRYCYLD